MKLLWACILLLCSITLVIAATTFTSPADNTVTTNPIIECTPTSAVDQLSLYYNNSGFTKLQSNTTQVTASQPYTFANLGLSEGSYLFGCAQTQNSTTTFSENRTVTIDTTNPTLTITSPQASASYDTTTITINFIAQDSNLNNCIYNFNGGTNTTLSSCQNTTATPQSGEQTLNLYAFDKAGNANFQAVTFTKTQDSAPPEIIDVDIDKEMTATEEMTVNIVAETNENATCKYDNFDESYNSMEDEFDDTDGLFHNITKVFTTELNRTYYFRCKDQFNNDMTTSENITFEVKFTEQASLIKETNKYTYEQEFIEAQETIKLDLNDNDFVTQKVEVTFDNDLEDIEITIKEYNSLPSALEDIDNLVKLIKFTTENIETTDIDEVEVFFEVDEDEVEVYSYINDEWNKEEVKESGEAFKVTTTELSYLAITLPSLEETEESGTKEETTSKEAKEEVQTKKPFDKKKFLWWTTLIALIIVLAGLIYFFKIHKSDFYGEES